MKNNNSRKTNLIECFNHTYNFSTSPVLCEATEKSILSNKVYKEDAITKHRLSGNIENKKEDKIINIEDMYSSQYEDEEYLPNVYVHEGTTFNWAREYINKGRVAVLNFANPVHPGGGVANGAMAQEECLCRSSNLYACLNAENVQEEYYEYHREMQGYFFSDRLIYTRDVTVFKNDDDVPVMLPEEQWFQVDVITCAAPCVAKRKYTNKAALKELFKGRIKNIFEAALDNDVEVLILGAFGCGAFKNPPELVASAFHEVILENEYDKLFKKIVFAIKSTTNNAPWDACPNIVAFQMEFIGISSELGKERMSGGVPIAYAYGDVTLPGGRVLKAGPEFLKYYEWKEKNFYKDKQFAILGDSISTLAGFNPRGYKVFYGDEKSEQSGVKTMSDTWWGKVIDYFGGELLVNNSWSGSRVTKLPSNETLFPSGCSDERTSSLHIGNIKPDVIIVYLGTNDWAFGVKPGNDTCILGEDDNELFLYAYEKMLRKLQKNYPDSEIWCCTLCETYVSTRPNFKFPHKYAGIHIEEFNEIIRDVVIRNNCRLIDLYAYKMAYDSIDGSHPTNAGMNTIATMIIRSMVGTDADQFLDCEEDQHDYEMYGQNGHGDYYRCKKCGKEKFICPWEDLTVEPEDNVNSETEYVMSNSNITTILESGTLRLTIESSGKTVQFQKDVVEVGRDKICDLLLEGKSTVAWHQATFFYERNMWFLRDNFSINGTWINGAKIQPGKKYQLETNDEINFAMAERVIFNKYERNAQPMGDSDEKELLFLEAGMAAFAESDHKDEVALKLIVAALSDAPLYIPVEIDFEAMLGSVEPMKLKVGDTLQPAKDVKMRILTLTHESGVEFVPMFTSNEEVNRGPSASIIRFYPQDYLPKLVQMDKPVIINPFSENRFLVSKELITEVLLPLVQNKTRPQTGVVEQTADKYIGKIIDNKYEVLKLIGGGGFYTTYLVKNIRANKTWAMKVCDKKSKYYSPII